MRHVNGALMYVYVCVCLEYVKDSKSPRYGNKSIQYIQLPIAGFQWQSTVVVAGAFILTVDGTQ